MIKYQQKVLFVLICSIVMKKEANGGYVEQVKLTKLDLQEFAATNYIQEIIHIPNQITTQLSI